MVTQDPLGWAGRSVLVTGHTGFKGGWLTLWLSELGACVHGLALDPPTVPSLYEVAKVRAALSSEARIDLGNLDEVRKTLAAVRPEVVFHLAAQPLVRRSYYDPVGTLITNVLGTAHVLEAARNAGSVRAIIAVTTDKVYQHAVRTDPYCEGDPLGGNDPYSASKAAAEIITASYRMSFFRDGDQPAVATARAGNVVGGADWARDRIVPDCIRAFSEGHPVYLRYPGAVRPWQHVLEPLSGYLELARRLLGDDGHEYASAWNFGPGTGSVTTVVEVARTVARIWGEGAEVKVAPRDGQPAEAEWLDLDSTRAQVQLGWQPRWTVEQALEHTVAWYRTWQRGAEMAEFTRSQIRDYEAALVA